MLLSAQPWVLLAAVAIAVVVLVRCQTRIAGPYRIVPGHIEDCPTMKPERLLYRLHYRGVRDRKNQDQWYYSANVTTYFTADDNYTGTFNLASWSSRGGWKDNAFHRVIPRMCSSAKALNPYVWQAAMKLVFDDPNRDCPFPPGFYSVDNVSTNFDPKIPPAFFYGKWRGTAWVNNSETGELLICKRFFFELMPKVPKRRFGG